MLKMRLIAAAVAALTTFSAGCGTTPPTPAEAAAKATAQGPADLHYSNKMNAPVFALEIVSSTVKSVRLHLQKE